MTTGPLQFNPALDLSDLAARYAERQRLQVRDCFTLGSAENLRDILENRTSWGLAFNDGNRVVCLDQAQQNRLTLSERRRIGQGVAQGAQKGYQFIYSIYPILQNYFDKHASFSPLFDIFEWLNGAEFLGFMRKLTGFDDILWADAQATAYGPGHFLKYHTDETPSQKRLAAYVINLTKGWGRDWGGHLNFFDDDYNIELGYRPLFNAINVFTVPAHHSVGYVANYAPRARMSITGWLRGDDPPILGRQKA